LFIGPVRSRNRSLSAAVMSPIASGTISQRSLALARSPATPQLFSPALASIGRRVPTVFVAKRSNQKDDDDGDQLVPEVILDTEVDFPVETDDSVEEKSGAGEGKTSLIQDSPKTDDMGGRGRFGGGDVKVEHKKPKRKLPRLSKD